MKRGSLFKGKFDREKKVQELRELVGAVRDTVEKTYKDELKYLDSVEKQKLAEEWLQRMEDDEAEAFLRVVEEKVTQIHSRYK